MTVAFTEYMFTPDYKSLAEKYFDFTSRRQLNSGVEFDELTDLQLFWIEFKDELLELSVKEDSQYSKARDLRFEWLVIDFTD